MGHGLLGMRERAAMLGGELVAGRHPGRRLRGHGYPAGERRLTWPPYLLRTTLLTTIRVLIADDQVMVRQGFTVLLNAEPGIEVVGQAVDGLDAVAKVAELAPDVVLMDIRMPVLGGIEATRRITVTARRRRSRCSS